MGYEKFNSRYFLQTNLNILCSFASQVKVSCFMDTFLLKNNKYFEQCRSENGEYIVVVQLDC